MLFLAFIRDLGLDLQTTEIFLLNDLGSELCIEKKRGKKRKRHTPQRGGKEVRWGSLSLSFKDTERETQRQTETKTEAANGKNEAESMQVRETEKKNKTKHHSRVKSSSSYHTYVLA